MIDKALLARTGPERSELLITIRDADGNLLDPVAITCSVEGGPECLPERVSDGVYLTAEAAVPVPGGCVVWRIQELAGEPFKETRQASDGGIYRPRLQEGQCQ